MLEYVIIVIVVWRCIEVVVTRTTRNRFVGEEPARGFESHHLRQYVALTVKLCLSFSVEGCFIPAH